MNTTTAYVDLAARGTAIATANTNDLATNNTKTSTQDVTAASLSYIEDAGPLAAIGLSTAFDVSGLAAGLYSLALKSGTDLVVKRVVVE